MHWSNPPHLIPMIEVIPGERTDAAVVDDAVALVERVGYEAVVEREVPGFVENRILYAIMREAVDLVDRGIVDADSMDRCVRWGIGYKLAVIGPMELLDMAGLDIYQAVSSYLNKDLSGATETSKTITDLTAEGRLGMKTGGGLYDYTPGVDRPPAGRAGAQAGRGAQGAVPGAEMKLYLLDTGSIVIDHAQLMWNIGGGTPVRIPTYALLIDHPDGLFMVDTGFDLEHTNRVLPFELPEQTPAQTIPEQLRACGYEPGDVDTLIMSHLHFDHCGGNKHLPHAKVVLHEKELPQAREPQPFERLRLLRPQLGHRGPEHRDHLGRRRDRVRPAPARDARAHGRPLLAAGRLGGAHADAVCDRRGLLRRGVREGRPAGLPQRPHCGRALDRADQAARRGARRRGVLLT